MSDQKLILCLDGGGVRGYFGIQLLTLLAQNAPKGKLSNVFDLIVGVSVGSFILALIGLGMLDFPFKRELLFQQLTDMYRDRNEYGILIAPKYNGKGKRDLLHRVFDGKRLKDMKTKVAIVCCSIGGRIQLFQSWNKDHEDLFVADVLDASSSVPCYFPVIRLKTKNHDFGYFVDGGIRSNTPLNHTWLQADQLWPQAEYRLLSIGTQNITELDVNDEFIQHMGLFAWLGMGIFDILTGVADDSEIRMMERLLGLKNFYRIHCDCGSMRLDDISSEGQKRMERSVIDTWSKHGNSLLVFCGLR
jgi:patatin-like phospholipase/acyl hydrolase